MVLQVENSHKKSVAQICFHMMPQFTFNSSSSCDIHGKDLSESLSIHLSSKVKSPSRCCLEVKHLNPGVQDQDMSSTQSTSQSQQEASVMGKPNSQEPCVSSKTVQDESYEDHVQDQARPAFHHPDFYTNRSQLDMNQSLIHIPYAYAEPYFSGLFSNYGPHVTVQPPMVGIGPARVPLPVDLAEDCPIYVNAKQYHGILRRRQMRAKLEAQNKLVKNRKPYLHESRHLHALNRVRGSGGRFVSTKKLQHSDATPTTNSSSDSIHFLQKANMLDVDEHRLEPAKHGAPAAIHCGFTQKTDSVVNFVQRTTGSQVYPLFPDRGGPTCNGEQHGAPWVVQ